MDNEQKINLLIEIQEQCNAISKGSMPQQEIQRKFSALKSLLIQEMPESEENCGEIEQLLAAPESANSELPQLLKRMTAAVSKLCSKKLSAILNGFAFVEHPIAEKIFHFFDIAPRTSAELYQLAFEACAKCSLSAPKESFRYTMQIFEEQPGLFSGEKSPHPGYTYQPSEQHTFERCPVCGGKGTPYFRAFSFVMGDFSYPDLPAKLWMKCPGCGNLYTWKYPKETLAQSENAAYVYADRNKYLTATQNVSGYALAVWSDILNSLQPYACGSTLLEVGVGSGELLAVALEMGYQADAVELVTSVAQRTADILGIPVWNGDFLQYRTEKTYSIIIMGDVIEHVSNPALALENARRLLDEDGVLWLSTPNFESSFSKMRKFDDPMWCEPHHVTYFSYQGFAALAGRCGFSIVRYTVSKRYNGSMELILKKDPDWDGAVDLNAAGQSAGKDFPVGQDSGRGEDFTEKSLEALITAGEVQQALDLIEALPQEERQRWQIQNLTGIVCAYCGQHREARTFFEAALAQQPNDAELLYNLADTCAALGMSRKAKELLERCQQVADSGELADDIAALWQELADQKGGQVLMAAYYFPPLAGSGVFRSIRFAKYLPLYGWQPTVISTDRPPKGWNFADQSIVAEIPENMDVIRIPDGISTGRETSLNGERVEKILGFLHGVLRFSPEADRIFSQLSKSREGIMQLLTFPCGALSWAFDAVQYIEKNMDLSRFEVVYTTSGPASAHLIGFYLKQKYGIPWVADYRDPWTFNAYGAPYDPFDAGQRLLYELESVLLRQADLNLTVVAGLTQEYERNFGLPAEKMASITNGYDEENFADLNVPAQTERFTINYSGLLYSGHRSIDPILRAIQQLCDEKALDRSDIRFRVVGNVVPENMAAAQKHGLTDILVQTGYLSHRAALQSNLESNLLLLLIGEGDNLKSFYSAKLFEYLRSGKPILAIAPKDSVVDQLLQESGHGKAFRAGQLPEIKAMIREEYLKWKNHRGGSLLHSPTIEKFEGKRLTQQLAEVLCAAASSWDPLPGTGSSDPAYRVTTYLVAGRRDDSFLERCAQNFLEQNYNYVWLKAMLQKASAQAGSSATLVTGSSYGVNGIIESKWDCAINCSASSQDLYYDFLCARKAVSGTKGRFSKCFIMDGYYAAFHDLSLGAQEREMMISNVYYPIFKDGHNWHDAFSNDLWSGIPPLSKEEKLRCERAAVEKILHQGTYFSAKKRRGGTVLDLGGRNWWDVPEEERQTLGEFRAGLHNKLLQSGSIAENRRILVEYVRFLRSHEIIPIFIIAPFAEEYNRYLSKKLKDSILELTAGVSDELQFADFNELSQFAPPDFVDTDHLSKRGAEKFSRLLVEMFGK